MTTYKSTEAGLVKEPAKWLRVELNGEVLFMTQDNPLVNTVRAYGNFKEFTEEEVKNYLAYERDEVYEKHEGYESYKDFEESQS